MTTGTNVSSQGQQQGVEGRDDGGGGLASNPKVKVFCIHSIAWIHSFIYVSLLTLPLILATMPKQFRKLVDEALVLVVQEYAAEITEEIMQVS